MTLIPVAPKKRDLEECEKPMIDCLKRVYDLYQNRSVKNFIGIDGPGRPVALAIKLFFKAMKCSDIFVDIIDVSELAIAVTRNGLECADNFPLYEQYAQYLRVEKPEICEKIRRNQKIVLVDSQMSDEDFFYHCAAALFNCLNWKCHPALLAAYGTYEEYPTPAWQDNNQMIGIIPVYKNGKSQSVIATKIVTDASKELYDWLERVAQKAADGVQASNGSSS